MSDGSAGGSLTKPSRNPLVESILDIEFPVKPVYEAFQKIAEGTKMQAASTPNLPEIEARRAYLLSLAAPVLQRHHEELLGRQKRAREAAAVAKQKEKEAKAAEKEMKRFYNRAEALADFRYWARMEHWTRDEAIALLLGRDPRVVTPQTVRREIESTKMLLGPPMSKFLADYENLHAFAGRAQAMKGPQLKPTDVVNWAATRSGYEVPAGLLDAISEFARLLLPAAAASPPHGERASAPPAAAPAPTTGDEAPNSVLHSTKAARRDILAPVVEAAQERCGKPFDTAAVWATLVAMAEKRVPPLLGSTEDGVQYLSNGEAATLSRNAFAKRLARAKGRA